LRMEDKDGKNKRRNFENSLTFLNGAERHRNNEEQFY